MHYSRMAPIGVMRFSGMFLIRPESVPDHAACCTTLAIMVVKDLRALGIEVNLENLIYRISIHDIPEAITSDVVRPLKYHHSALTKEFKIAETDMIRAFGYPEDIINDIELAKDNSSIEGYLMEVIDALQVATKLYEELFILNNRSIEDEYNSVMNLVHKVINKSLDLYGDKVYNYLNSIYLTFFNHE